MKPICLYHSSDLDGKCSGAIIFHVFRGEIEMYGMDYGDPIPWDKLRPGRRVILVDFSFQPFSEMLRLFCRVENVAWIDHHKSVFDEAEKFGLMQKPTVSLSMDFAACELAWKFYAAELAKLFPSSSSMPLGVQWLGRYDIWKHEDKPDILNFQSGMKTYETHPTADIWPLVFKSEHEFLDKIIHRGEVVRASMKFSNDDFAKKLCFATTIDGFRVLAANRGPVGSYFFKSLWDPEKYDVMASFYLRPDGQWSISMYSDKQEVDCSVIAKARGGGGHKGAAGFQSRSIPFDVG